MFFFFKLRNVSRVSRLLLRVKKVNDMLMHYYFSKLGYGLSFSSFLCFVFVKEFSSNRFFNLIESRFYAFFNIYFLKFKNFLVYRQELLRLRLFF